MSSLLSFPRIAFLGATSFLVPAHGQGFFNLNFEQAKIIPIAGTPFVATTNALPGWTVFIGNSQQSEITYNDPSLGATWVTLWATNGQQIAGNFSVDLEGRQTGQNASISQTGLVPASVLSLLFEASSNSGGPLQVSLGGQLIPINAISTGPNYILYGGDISGFAGQTAQLTFSSVGIFANFWNIDNIQFSTSPIPEPSAIALAALGAVIFGFRHLKNHFKFEHRQNL